MLAGHALTFVRARFANVCANGTRLKVKLRIAAHKACVEKANVGAVAAQLDASGHSRHIHPTTLRSALFAELPALQAEANTFFKLLLKVVCFC